MQEPIEIGGSVIKPGERHTIQLPVARLYTRTDMTIPVEVLHGKTKGPRAFVCAMLHGDEINGMEIIRQVLDRLNVQDIRGTFIAVPIVNVFGFVYESRYLPDRRDLNRSFPGSATGSLASQLAHLFMREIADGSDYGIDLHTAAPPRNNLPQIRADLHDSETRRIAEAFGAPVVIHAKAPHGSLRQVAAQRGIRMLLYEAGEPHRFNQDAIRIGVKGVLRVLSEVRILKRTRTGRRPMTLAIESTRWIRARQSGILRLNVELGEEVRRQQRLGIISDPLGDVRVFIKAPCDGLIIGQTDHPLVHRGDAILHLALTESCP